MTDDLTIVYPRLRGPGWDPITVMARSVAKYLDARIIEYPARDSVNRLRGLLSVLPRRRNVSGSCLVIASRPAYLLSALRIPHWLQGFRSVSAWVIDSFWTEQIPRAIWRNGHLDQVFVANGDVAAIWNRISGVPTSWLPIASDVLARGSNRTDREIDLLRVGRQPPEWDNDESNEAAAAERGVVYVGRPPYHPEPDRNHASLCDVFARSKFTLAFTNSVNPAGYTHPTREYLTSRWADALASGSIVAGVGPRCMESDRLLWPGALLEIGSTSRDAGLGLIADARREWSPSQALCNYAGALRTLDVRWRCKEIANLLGIRSATLKAEMSRLETRLEEVGRGDFAESNNSHGAM